MLLGLVYFGDGLYVDAHPQAPGGFLQCVPLFRLVSDLAAHPHALSWQLSVRPFVWFDWYPGRKTISRLQLNSVRPLLCFDWSLHIWTLTPKPFTGPLHRVRFEGFGLISIFSVHSALPGLTTVRTPPCYDVALHFRLDTHPNALHRLFQCVFVYFADSLPCLLSCTLD